EKNGKKRWKSYTEEKETVILAKAETIITDLYEKLSKFPEGMKKEVDTTKEKKTFLQSDQLKKYIKKVSEVTFLIISCFNPSLRLYIPRMAELKKLKITTKGKISKHIKKKLGQKDAPSIEVEGDGNTSAPLNYIFFPTLLREDTGHQISDARLHCYFSKEDLPELNIVGNECYKLWH
ncbi:MAG: hypothetical protein AAF335_02650, partial [Bacteroidota bacterium]